jgi:ABC-2 type transport system permease protein
LKRKDAAKMQEIRSNPVQKALDAVGTINIPMILAAFLFYFLGGYLLYSAMFAAIGAAVDNETDTQQFMFPVTIPLILGIFVAQFSIRDPDSSLSFWMSIIPFTSPIVMMVRIPFNPPIWEVLLSMGLLIAGFIGTIALAGRIYRVGILMYGKKVTFKELGKWLFYKG